jgi:hypothetical protein
MTAECLPEAIKDPMEENRYDAKLKIANVASTATITVEEVVKFLSSHDSDFASEALEYFAKY